jgi:hypothetical protein
MNRLPRKFLILSMAFVAVGAFLANRYLPLWRDTIFHCDEGGSVELPSGVVVPTNRWVNLGDAMNPAALGQIGDAQGGPHYLVMINYNPSRKVLLATESGAAPLIVTSFRFSGPKVRREYWVKRE